MKLVVNAGFVQGFLQPDRVRIRHHGIGIAVYGEDGRQAGANVGEWRNALDNLLPVGMAAKPGNRAGLPVRPFVNEHGHGTGRIERLIHVQLRLSIAGRAVRGVRGNAVIRRRGPFSRFGKLRPNRRNENDRENDRE